MLFSVSTTNIVNDSGNIILSITKKCTTGSLRKNFNARYTQLSVPILLFHPYPPLVAGVAGLLDVLLGGVGMQPEALARFVGEPLALVPFMVFILIFGPLPEEIGWRGYALDRLQTRWNAVGSSLILGSVWTLWHTPLFFIEGSYHHGLGFGTTGFWLFVGNLILVSVVMTWIYNNTNRSTLSAILFHFMINFVGELFTLSGAAEVYQLLAWVGVVLVIVLVWKADTSKTCKIVY